MDFWPRVSILKLMYKKKHWGDGKELKQSQRFLLKWQDVTEPSKHNLLSQFGKKTKYLKLLPKTRMRNIFKKISKMLSWWKKKNFVLHGDDWLFGYFYKTALSISRCFTDKWLIHDQRGFFIYMKLNLWSLWNVKCGWRRGSSECWGGVECPKEQIDFCLLLNYLVSCLLLLSTISTAWTWIHKTSDFQFNLQL